MFQTLGTGTSWLSETVSECELDDYGFDLHKGLYF